MCCVAKKSFESDEEQQHGLMTKSETLRGLFVFALNFFLYNPHFLLPTSLSFIFSNF